MKLVLFCLLLFFAVGLKASNDTLTCAQVYNFNVGDTFDYRNVSSGYSSEVPYINPYDFVSYYRIEILGKFYSQNQDTLFYSRLKYTYPNNFLANAVVTSDTMIITNLPMPALFYNYYMASDTVDPSSYDSIANTASFDGRAVNKAYLNGFENWRMIVFADGLGQICYLGGGGDGAGEAENDTTVLIYYSQNGETWGTPASIIAGIVNMSKLNPAINLFPTVNNGRFKVKITDSNYQSCQLIVYDLTGREIKRTVLDKSTSDIDVEGASAGMYLWQVVNGAQTLQTGKLIIQ